MIILYEKTKRLMRKNLIRYFINVFEKEYDVYIKKIIDFQSPSIYYYINHIFFYYIKNCFREALRK